MKDKFSLVKNILISKILGKPHKMNFVVTSACNSRCMTCNIWKVYKNNPSISKKELTIEEIDKIFKALPKTISWLNLTGGEPFLRNDFDKIVYSAIKNIPHLKLIGINSNGLARDRIIPIVKKIMEIKHPDIIITISIDGPESTHDRIRGLKGAYRQSMGTYKELKELTKDDEKFSIAIETTLSKENLDSLPPFLKELIKKTDKLPPPLPHNAALYHNENNAQLFPKDQKKTKDILSLAIKTKRITSPQDVIERIFIKKVLGYIQNQKKQVMPCVAFRASFSLDQFGNVMPCLMWGYKVRNVRDFSYSILSILNSEDAKRVRAMIKNKKCPNCWTPCEAYQSIISELLSFRIFPL